MDKGLSVRALFEQYGRRLGLELVAGEEGLDKEVRSREIHRPGLALTGFVDLYSFDRVQLLGNTEMLYLQRCSEAEQLEALETIYQFDLPCVIVTGDYPPLPILAELADRGGIPLLKTSFATTKFIHLFTLYLEDFFAPRVSLHGSLVDVYGVGLLITGRSGIGKSEIALDLVERGHRLVADDHIIVTRRTQGTIVGTGVELTRENIEVRGIGIVDVRRMFGVRGIRREKRIEVEVHLVDWDDSASYERLGIEDKTTVILEVEIPLVTVPIFPGKNITVIAEVIALNHLLRVHGHHPARELDERLIRRIREQSQGQASDALGPVQPDEG